MNTKGKIILLMGLAVAMMLGVYSYLDAASTTTYTYSNLTTEINRVNPINDSSITKTLGVNTRPSTGSTVVTIRKADKTYCTSKSFPAYNSVTNLTTSVPSGELREIFIKSETSSAISGDLIIYWN